MKKLFFISILILSTLSACQKNKKDDPKDIEKTADIVVPSGFNFENSKDLSFTIKITDNRFGAVGHRITVFDADPSDGGKVLAIGGATINKPFVGRIDNSVLVKEIFIQKKAPSGETFTRKVVLANNTLEIELGENNGQKVEDRTVSPNCSIGCTQPLPSGSNLNLSGNNTYCMTEPFNGNITIGGNAVLRICSNATIGNLNMNGNSARIIVTTAGVVNFNQNASMGGEFENFGTVTFNQGATFQGAGGRLINHSEITVGQTLIFNSNTSTNNGSISVGGSMTINSNATLVNNCQITINSNSDVNGILHNHGYLKYNNNLTLNGNNSITLSMNNGAMLVANNLMLNRTIQGYGSSSLVKIFQNTTINSQGALRGILDFCDANGIETNNGTIEPSVTLSCNMYLPQTSCNPEGNGELPDDDEDGDNIPDDLDDFPTDPRQAFSIFFPSENELHSLVYEDLWPGLGDFDMNDIVIDFRYNLILDSENRVVQINGRYELVARGGGLTSGFAVQLPVLRSNISEVSGGDMEGSGSFAVIRVFDNAKDHMDVFNTVQNEPLAEPVIFNIAVTLTNPQPLNEIGLGVYNPFIWRNEPGAGRGHEIHVAGKIPTVSVDASLFGTMDDNTNPAAGILYLSKSNLCWGIYIPAKFSYPKEGSDITRVYFKFAEWVQSGGVLSQDWYIISPQHTDVNLLHSVR